MRSSEVAVISAAIANGNWEPERLRRPQALCEASTTADAALTTDPQEFTRVMRRPRNNSLS